MPGLIRGVARTAVVAGTATAVSNRVNRRQQGRWAAQQQYAYDAPAPAPAPPAGSAAPDMGDRIEQLK
ncbi:SHOCT domain-containing protein, partial [Streptomyces scabiei]|nr:SHOCT domain-containing protein [Streptomyces scabiei]